MLLESTDPESKVALIYAMAAKRNETAMTLWEGPQGKRRPLTIQLQLLSPKRTGTSQIAALKASSSLPYASYWLRRCHLQVNPLASDLL
ncbi:hypothetical protein PVK06_042510 [Gossypium arboreum]|uniref:Uncharacterized protein n=1 Tax=Gossypium arboreum TaxID=29729 RepID=A0ABR0MKZ7_GOSAR|nr:hypothetical protein PVK06_042510 [Gossypium arboreum]